MTRLGEKLRGSVVGQLVARADEAERQRDDARGAKDQALSQLAATREAHEFGQRAGAKLNDSVEAVRAVLRDGGFLTYSSLSLADDVARALGRLREQRNEAREAADAWRPAIVDANQPSTNLEESRDDTVRRLAREIIATRDVLAPDVSTQGTPLDEVARTALKVAWASSAAAELRWWVEPGNAPGQDMVPRSLLAKRAAALDPGGAAPEGSQPPTPTLSHDDFEVRGTDPHAACDGRIRSAFNTLVEVADALGFEHDGKAIDTRALVGFAQGVRRSTTRVPDAKAGHPDEVLAALRAADRAGEVHAQPGYRIVRPGELSYTEALVVLARAVRAYAADDDVVDATIGCGAEAAGGRICGRPEGHEGAHVPSWTVLDSEQVAREAAHQAVFDGGVERSHAPDVVDALARAGFVPGVYPPGMAIDGDMLRGLITDALPRWATDEFAGELADNVLDAAVRAGFTILHGKTLTPRPPAEPEQHWAEKAIERAREYLASQGYRRIVDDHGEDLVAMLREIGVAADPNSTRLALIDEHLVPLGIVASSDDGIVDGVGQLARQYVELRERATRIGSPAGGGIFEISRERTQQQYDGGYTLQHDDQHTAGELIAAARVYLGGPLAEWPWPNTRPPQLRGTEVGSLAKAGALIAAEIDRLRRAENRTATDAAVADAATQDAASVWSSSVAPGGYVCQACGMPTESEPCRDHQPKAYAAMTDVEQS